MEFNKSWNEYILYDLANWKNGLAFKDINFSNKGKPIIKIAELKNGITEQTKYTDGDYGEEVYLRKNDLIFSWSGNPKTSIDAFLYDLPEGYLNQHSFKITEKKEVVEKYFLYYVLKYLNPMFQSTASDKQTTGLGHVTIADLKKIKVRIPDLEVQYKILNIVKNIDDKIYNNNQINDNLYKIIEQYIKEQYYNNENVQIGNVGNIGKIQGGYAFKSKDLLNDVTNNKIFKIKNISASGVDIDNTQCVYDEVADKVDKKFLLIRGNVIIAMTGAELGKTGYLYGNDNRYFLNQRVGVIRGNDKYSELYLNCLFLLKDMQNTLNSKGYGSAQPNISTSDIENIEVPIPKEDELKKFYEVCNPIYNKMILNSEQNQSLTQLRDTLLPKLMNGEIDLDKIEI